MGTKYSAQQFIEAIHSTGGIISVIASRVGCDWHTVRRYIDGYPTVRQAYKDERHKITDVAQHNIIKAIRDGDLQMSKWWLQVMDNDFTPKQELDLLSGGQPITIREVVVELPPESETG